MVNYAEKEQEQRQRLMATRLRAWIDEHPELPQGELASACNVSPQAVTKWKRTGQIARDHVPLVEAFFGKSPGSLTATMSVKDPAETNQYFHEFKNLNPTERRLVAGFRGLPPDQRAAVTALVDSLVHLGRRAGSARSRSD